MSLPKSWFEEINAIKLKYGLEEYNKENIPNLTKRKWKKIIKDQINKYIQDLINKNTSSKTKHLKTFKKQEYLDVMPFEERPKK